MNDLNNGLFLNILWTKIIVCSNILDFLKQVDIENSEWFHKPQTKRNFIRVYNEYVSLLPYFIMRRLHNDEYSHKAVQINILLYLFLNTSRHCSRMRSAPLSSRGGRCIHWGCEWGVHPLAGVNPRGASRMHNLPCKQNDRRLWKHYLFHTPYAGGNYNAQSSVFFWFSYTSLHTRYQGAIIKLRQLCFSPIFYNYIIVN